MLSISISFKEVSIASVTRWRATFERH